MSEWENWKRQQSIKWRDEIEDPNKNKNIIDKMCKNQSNQMPTIRLKNATYRICKEELLAKLSTRQLSEEFLKFKHETIEFSKVNCMNLPGIREKYQTQGIETAEFKKCMDEENQKILDNFWNLTALHKIKYKDTARKPLDHYKNIENVEKEILNLSVKLGFVPDFGEIKVLRSGLYGTIKKYKYSYPQIAMKVKSIMRQISDTP